MITQNIFYYDALSKHPVFKTVHYQWVFKEVLSINQNSEMPWSGLYSSKGAVRAGYSRTHLLVINTLKCGVGVSVVGSTLGADGAAVWIHFP